MNKNRKGNELIEYVCAFFSGLVYYISTSKMAASLPSQIPPLLSIENNSLFIQGSHTEMSSVYRISLDRVRYPRFAFSCWLKSLDTES